MSALPPHLNRSKLHVGRGNAMRQAARHFCRVLKKSSALMIGHQAKIILLQKTVEKQNCATHCPEKVEILKKPGLKAQNEIPHPLGKFKMHPPQYDSLSGIK
jgi:hypothetical protein